ncbi:MAG: phosphoglycerate mutase (2,3-diphosphoglycerate-independent) [Alphaproteobacteria bacterium 41-28]|nr:MAG: phosphoglycerate mutase (2,3-diphosphoglycerate-independent) [Alphaproteobacteria bacterium 41-28]
MAKAVVLCILDGWGHRENGSDNAITRAKTPHWNELMAHSPHTLLKASELNVGLPEGQMGNSEVGHMNIGAGRLILQDLPRIDEAIRNHTIEDLAPLKDFMKALKNSGGTCHLLGLLSPGGIHSHETHIKALSAILANQGIPVAIHAFLDGRDTPPQSAGSYLSSLLTFIKEYPLIKLATVGGRYYGMDRDKRWDRIEKAYKTIVEGTPRTGDVLTYLHQSYEDGITDEFVMPAALESYHGMKDGDGLFMANFRSDRARQILTALLDPNFQDFKRDRYIHFTASLGMTEYSETLNTWMKTLFPSSSPQDVLGEVIAAHGLKQLRIAETEKYAHVTFFFNGGRETSFPEEDRILIPSPKVATYDLQPEMSAYELTDRLIEAIENGKYTLIVVNYANTDMVGHTGNFEATRKAVEVVDTCLGRIKTAVEKSGVCLLITADHGNAEVMYDESLKSPHTAHTTNPVPLVMFNGPRASLHPGRLCDIAPTILQILDFPKPPPMTGSSLLETKHEE